MENVCEDARNLKGYKGDGIYHYLFIYLSDKYNTSNNIIVHDYIYPALLGLLVTINTTYLTSVGNITFQHLFLENFVISCIPHFVNK